jgi:hypothetical protein
LHSGVSSDAVAMGLLGPSELVLLDPQSSENDGEDIIITGRPLTGRTVYEDDYRTETTATGTGGGGTQSCE